MHVRHDIGRLVSPVQWARFSRRIRDAVPAVSDSVFRNACIDSSLCCLRSLDEFFKPPSHNYVSASEFNGFQSPGPFLNDHQRPTINNYVSHLTWERVSPSTDKLQTPSLQYTLNAIEDALPSFEAFYEHVLKNFLKPDDEEYELILRQLAGLRTWKPYFRRWRERAEARI